MNYICEYSKSIPNILCNEIIELFESEENKDTLVSDVNKSNTTHFIIPKNDEKWKRIELFLYTEMTSKLKKYVNKHKNSVNYNIFGNNELYVPNFIIQKYKKQKGECSYQDDHYIENNSLRVITFIWYLNTIDEGGDTIFWENYKLHSEQGKMVLFPSAWSYPYMSEIPISNDKYVITGWIYEKNK